MGENDDLVEYRVTKLEDAVGTLSTAVDNIETFLTSIKVWVKVLAVVWTLAQAAIIALIWVLIQHLAS